MTFFKVRNDKKKLKQERDGDVILAIGNSNIFLHEIVALDAMSDSGGRTGLHETRVRFHLDVCLHQKYQCLFW